MSPQKEIIKTIKKHSDEIKNYGVERIGLFGSFARANQRRRSDIDILVEFDRDGKTFDNYMNLKFFLEKVFRRRVDLVIKDALKTRIKKRILSEVKYA